MLHCGPSALHVDRSASPAYICLGTPDAVVDDKPLRGKPEAAEKGAHLFPEGLENRSLRQGGHLFPSPFVVVMKPDSIPFAQFIAGVLDARLAESIRVIDLRGVSSLTDAVVVASATSGPHLRALESEVARKVREHCDNDAARISGDAASAWIVMDYFNVIVHLFLPEARAYYNIEALWAKGTEVDVPHAER